MNKRQKILFYGNCHMCVISNFFAEKLNDEFDVFSCEECNVMPHWNSAPAFAVWSPENKPHQLDHLECVHEKLKQTDVFVFQHFGGGSVIDKLKTEYLCNEILPKNAIKICLPDFRFFADLNEPRSIKPWADYAKTKTCNSNEIIDFLQNSDDPHLVQLFQNEYPYNKEFVGYRCENYERYDQDLKRYDIRINMNDWVEENLGKQIITHTHCHPTEIYYKETISRIYNHININEDKYPIESVNHARGDTINPEQFKFFRSQFPDMDYSGISGRPIIDKDIKNLLGL